MVRAADDSADHLVFALGRRFELHVGWLSRLHRFLDSELGNIKAVLHIRGGHDKIDIVAAFDLDNRWLNGVLLHDYRDVFDRSSFLVALASRGQTGENPQH